MQQTNSSTVNAFVDSLYNKMSMEEKIAQLHGIHLDQFFDENNQLDTLKCAQMIAFTPCIVYNPIFDSQNAEKLIDIGSPAFF